MKTIKPLFIAILTTIGLNVNAQYFYISQNGLIVDSIAASSISNTNNLPTANTPTITLNINEQFIVDASFFNAYQTSQVIYVRDSINYTQQHAVSTWSYASCIFPDTIKYIGIYPISIYHNYSGSNVYYDFFIKAIQSNTTGIKQNSVANLTVYPNPANSTISVNGTNNETEIKIFDMLGKAVINEKELKAENNTATIDISTLQNGVYFIQVGNSTQKFIKQ